MHQSLPEGNTKLVLILSRPWALPTIGPGLHGFLPNPPSDPGLHDPFVDDVLTTVLYECV